MPIVFLFVAIDIRVVNIAKNLLARAAAAVPVPAAVLGTRPEWLNFKAEQPRPCEQDDFLGFYNAYANRFSFCND